MFLYIPRQPCFELMHSHDIADAEVLEAMALAKGDGIELPAGTSRTKHSTLWLIIRIRKSGRTGRATSISEEVVSLEQKLFCIEYCIGQLLPNQATVIRNIYFEKKDLKSLALEMT